MPPHTHYVKGKNSIDVMDGKGTDIDYSVDIRGKIGASMVVRWARGDPTVDPRRDEMMR